MQTALNRTGRIRLFPLLFQNVCSQSSQFLPQARRIVGSGDENGTPLQINACAFAILWVVYKWVHMKAPAIKDLHYSWYLKILSNCATLTARSIFRESSNITRSVINCSRIHTIIYFFGLFHSPSSGLWLSRLASPRLQFLWFVSNWPG